jgi:SAM-dependent methyltransferase
MAKKVLRRLLSKLSAVLITLVTLIFPYFLSKGKKLRIKSWQKALNLPQHERVFKDLYKKADGFNLSRLARKNKQDSIDFTYGEIEFLPFIALLSLAKPDKDTVFYDIGSGNGKAVIACAMVYPVHRSVGIELLPALYYSACEQNKRLEATPGYKEKAKAVKFILGDFLSVTMEDATCIFINSSTLFGLTWEKLCEVLNKLPHLKTVITTSKPLISDIFLPITDTHIQMSWGVVQVYIHQRKTNSTNPLENIE